MNKKLNPGQDPAQDSEVKTLFAARFNQVCTDAGIPPKGQNRQALVAARYGVSQKGARKWLEAEGLPTLEKSIQIAQKEGVHLEWLLTGRGPKKVRQDPLNELDKGTIDLARKIAAMPETERALVMRMFASAVTDTDPRLRNWRAK